MNAGHHTRSHSVRFYVDDASLCRLVAEFVGDGLATGEPAVVIATPSHKEQIARGLAARYDVEQLEREGMLRFLDAEEILPTFMRDGAPDADAFQRVVGGVLDRAAARQAPAVRAYGEMVDVLWKEGATAAAIRLEVLWNELAESRTFSLLCGYSMGNFYKRGAYEDICRQHTHVLSSAGHPVPVLVE